MDDITGDGEFWLPSEFLTDADDDILMMDKQKLGKNRSSSVFEADVCFPAEFPYEFGSSSDRSSPVDSVLGSAETESDEEDLLAGLAHQFAQSSMEETQKIGYPTEKSRVLSGSPQSTLSAVGSWSGRSPVSSNGTPNGPSPTGTPLGPNDDAWDLIYAAAGQVARLKMNGEGPQFPGPAPRAYGLLRPPQRLPPFHPPPPVKNPITDFYADRCNSQFHHVRQNQAPIWDRPPVKENLFYEQNQIQRQRLQRGGNGRCGNQLGLSEDVWPPLQVQRHHHHNRNQNQNNQTQNHGGGSGMRAVFLGGSAAAAGVKRESCGTGVFLPRRYGNPPDVRRKSGCSTALLPARVVQALNNNFNGMATQPHHHHHHHPQPNFNGSLIPDYDIMVARRNAMLAQQKRFLQQERTVNHEIHLPQEWTY